MSTQISGIVRLEGELTQADLYLVDLDSCSTVQSDPTTGEYTFIDLGDNSVIPDSDNIMVICHYGSTVRPMAHGPIQPADYWGDPYWDNVLLLLPFGSDFNDVSGNGNDATAFGDAAISSSQTLFGNDTLALDGTGDYCTSPVALDVTEDFTVEFAWRPANTSGTVRSLFYAGSGSGAAFHCYQNGTDLRFDNGLVADFSASGVLSAGVWSHIALVKSGTTITCYVDGESAGSSTSSQSLGTPTYISIGRFTSAIPYYSIGSYANLRVTQGVARYTEDFTPPTQAFPTSSV